MKILLQMNRLHPRSSLLRWAIVVLFAAAVLILIFNEIAIWSTSRRLALRLERLRDTGDPATFEEFVGPPIDAALNSAISLERAAASASKALSSFQAQTGASAATGDTRAGLPASVLDKITLDADYERNLQLADSLPQYRSLVSPLSPKAALELQIDQKYLDLGRIETARARRLMENGQPDEACRLMLRQLRLSRRWVGREPFTPSDLYGELVQSMSMEVLNRCLQEARLQPQTYDAIDAELRDDEGILLSSRRAAVASRLWSFHLHDIEELQFMRRRILGAWANLDAWRYLDLIDECTAMEGKQYRALPLDARNEIRAKYSAGWQAWLHPGTATYTGGMLLHRSVRDLQIVTTRCLRIVNAYCRRRPHPKELGELDLPDAVTIDPFGGAPLRMIPKGKGVLVYSVGADRESLGGIDIGFGPY